MGIVSIEQKTRKPGPCAPNRRCAEGGCDTVLNRYNESDRCHAHRPDEKATSREQRDSFSDLMAEMPERSAA